MSSHNNRRVRAQRKRHAKTILRLRDRIRTLTEQGRMKEAKKVVELAAELVWQNRKPEPIAAPVAPYVLKHTYHHKIGTPLGLTPTSPVLSVAYCIGVARDLRPQDAHGDRVGTVRDRCRFKLGQCRNLPKRPPQRRREDE
jgi:hypothetical protein